MRLFSNGVFSTKVSSEIKRISTFSGLNNIITQFFHVHCTTDKQIFIMPLHQLHLLRIWF